ncbi:hypothetical protein predicted by Glimmer/Critica [Limosilactobacillus fermentum]|nr:hypothetical protein predicted by Glimmer/Critica [Limosilactobacillus fermentum]
MAVGHEDVLIAHYLVHHPREGIPIGVAHHHLKTG